MDLDLVLLRASRRSLDLDLALPFLSPDRDRLSLERRLGDLRVLDLDLDLSLRRLLELSFFLEGERVFECPLELRS